MKMCNSSHALILVALALVLALAVPLKAQDQPEDYLAVHNEARENVGVPRIKWSNELVKYAWNYAQQVKGACDSLPSNKGGSPGRNWAWKGGDMSGADAVRMWSNEKSNYKYNSNMCHPGTKCYHYTQVVWRKTEWVGCAKVKCEDVFGTIVACYYSPVGNIQGQLPW